MAKGGPEQSMGQQGQSQSMAPQGMPQQTQGLGALQNAYSQFQNSAPPQPNPMFGEQPNPTAMAQQTSNVLDAYMDVGQQAPQAQPAPMAPPMMAPPMMPQAPNFGQIGQEDPRMQAMRNMQRYRGGM